MLDLALLKEYSGLFKSLKNNGEKLIVLALIASGERPLRQYELVELLGVNERHCRDHCKRLNQDKVIETIKIRGEVSYRINGTLDRSIPPVDRSIPPVDRSIPPVVEAFAWAVASGRKKFPIAFSSSAKTTKNFVASFSSLFLDLPGIAEDYPEIIIPLKAKTEASKQRRVVYQGETVRVAWPNRDQGLYCFQFPDIPGNRSCFAHVISQSISSRMRGMFYAAPGWRKGRTRLWPNGAPLVA